MLQLHSASDEEISYLQSFARKRHGRSIATKHHTSQNELLLEKKINHLETKIRAYEASRKQILDKILEIL